MVFCMKYRKKLLNNDITNFLKITCSEIGERYSFVFDAIGCDGDHVHLFVGAEPKNSPSIYIPTPPLIFSLNFVDLVILALVDGDYFLQIIKNSRFLLPFQSKNL
jgi:putative transposase